MAKARRKESVKLLGVARRRRGALLMSTALQASVVIVLAVPGLTRPAAAQPAPNARPTGGAVVGGSITISQAPTQTTINQTSARGAVTWQTYNVGSQQSVVYHQPSSSSVTLNRIDDSNPSQIAGRIEANGQIVLMNQAGITFYKGAQVNTNGLMVTAASMSKGAMRGFVNTGAMKFDRAANPNAQVVNQGNITIRQAGLAALVAPAVANSGTITARLGHVVLAGATKTTLDMYGDGLVSIDVSGQVTKAPVGPDGKPVTALVTNTGVIRAEGGTVQLTAREADGVVTNLVDAGGRISANSIAGHTGVVALNGVGGGIVIDGRVSAAGRLAGTQGGAIEANTDGNVTVTSTARIDASGKAGGGTVAIGTTLARARGGPSVTPTLTATNVRVQKGAVISADATAKGNGGRVTLLSTNSTEMDGMLTAKGGPLGGDGGFIEVSGGSLGLNNGSIDVSAVLGKTGSVLFDPDNLTIVSSGGNIDGSFTGTLLAGDDSGQTDTLSGSVLDGISGNVTLQAKNILEVASSFTIGSGALTMQAGGNLEVDPGVTVAASGDILALTTAAGTGIGIAGLLTSTGGSVFLHAAPGSGIALANFGTISAPTAGKSIVLQTDTLALNGGHILASSGTVEIAPTTAGDQISLGNGNSSGTLGLAGNLGGIRASLLRLGAVTFDSVMTTTAGGITFDTNTNLTGIASTLDVHATGDIIRSADTLVLTVGTLTGSAGGNLLLAGGVSTGNVIGTVGSFSVGAGDAFQLLTSGGVTFAGPVNGGANVYVADVGGGNIAVTGSIGATSEADIYGVGGGTLGISGSVIAPAVTLGMSGTIKMTGSAVVGQAGGTLAVSASNGFSEVNTGTIAAGTLEEAGGLYGLGSLSALGTDNAVSSLGAISAGGDLAVVSKSALTIADTVAATGSISLQDSNAGGITVAGAGTLTSPQSISLTTTGSGTLAIKGYVSSAAVGLTSASTLTQAASSTIIGTSSVAATGTALTLAGTITDGGASPGTGTVTLNATGPGAAGTIDTSSGVIVAGTLTGNATGAVTMSGVNAVANLGSFSADSFMLNNGAHSLSVFGPVTAPNGITLSNSGAAGITVTGSLIASGGTLTLDAGDLGIALNAGDVLTANTVHLFASDGSITQVASGRITAGSLQAQAYFNTTGGNVSLLGTNNAIDDLIGFDVAEGGSFNLVDASFLTVTGSVYSASNILLRSSNASGIEVDGTIAAIPATGTASIEAPKLVINGGTITGGTFEFAPISGGLTIGGAAGALTSLAGIGPSNIRLGRANGTTTATSITLGGTFDAKNQSLELDSTGGITDGGFALINVATLSGTAGGTVSLMNTGNSISNLANFTVTTGDLDLVDSAALTFSAGNYVDNGNAYVASSNAGGITASATGWLDASGTTGIQTDALTVLGVGYSFESHVFELAPYHAGTTVFLGGSGSGLVLSTLNDVISAPIVRIGAVTVPGSGLTTTAGSIVVAGAFGSTFAGTLVALELDSKGGIDGSAGALSAATLTGSAGGDVLLTNGGNDIQQLGDFTTSGNFSLTDPTALVVVGTVAVGPTFPAAPNPANNKTLTIDASGGGSITLGVNGGASGVLNSGTVTLSGNQGVSEPNGTIIANSMSVTSSSGAVMLDDSTNNVTTVTGGTASGDLVLIFDPTTTLTGTYSGSNVFLGVAHAGDGLQLGSNTVGATVTATAGSNPRISLVADQITEGAAASTVTATNGTVELAPFTTGTPISLAGTASAGTLLLDATLLGDISTGTGSLVVGRYTDLPNGGTLVHSGGAISIDGLVNLAGHAQTLLLDSSGTISEPTGTLAVNTLTGTAISVALTGTANTIANLASFDATQDFTLSDNTALNVVGSVTAGTNITLAILNGGSLLIGNPGTIGRLDAGGTVALRTTGSIAEDPNNGSIIAATLLGPASAAGATAGASLVGSNTITALGDFYTDATTGNFQLLDQHALTVLGTVVAGSTLGLDVAGGGSLAIGNASTAGVLNAGTTGTVTLQSTGSITQDANNGTIIAHVLNGPSVTASAAAGANLTNLANQVGTLGTFLTVNDFNFRNGIPLTLAGLVQSSGGSVFIQEAAGNGLSFNGGSVIVSGTTIGLIADSLSYTSGTIDAGLGSGGTVEIAPTSSGTAVGLGGGSGLVLGSAALGAISADELHIGGYHDATNGGAQTVTAGSIDIAGNVSLAAGAVHRLRLDTSGAVTESTGTLSVGTLVGTASNGFTIAANSSNAIGTLGATGVNGTLTATNGNIRILDAGPLAVQNAVSALNGNIFLKDAAGQTLSFLNGGSAVVSSGTIGLVSDLLSVASGASIIASSGTVEIAPTTAGTSVTLAGAGGGLSIDSTALAAIQAGRLRIGGYLDQANGNANVVTAGSIDLAGAVDLTAVAPALRLDSTGPITETGGPLTVGTLSISTNGSAADVTLGNTLNDFATLANITVGGNLTLMDDAGTLTLPTNAVVYGSNVTIDNAGSVLVLGDLGAAAGTLSLTAGADMTVGSGGNTVTLIGATGAATLSATGAFNQLGGLINANGVSITAGTTLTQSGGTIINAGTSTALVINAGSRFAQGSNGVIASNQDGTISTGASGSIVTSGTILTAGTLALVANTFTQSAGTIAAGGDLLVENSTAGAALGGNILQAGGTMAAGGMLALIGDFTNSDASQTGGVLAGSTIAVTSATENTPFQNFAPAVQVNVGGNTTVACVCTGLVTAFTNPSPAAPGSTPSLPTLAASGASRPHHLLLDVIDGTTPSAGGYMLSQAISADWVEIHTSGAFTEAPGGTITATLLSGSAGYAPTGSGPSATFTTPYSLVVSDATLNNGNSITDLGRYLATGDFRLTNASSLTVVGTIVAGGTAGGHVLALTAPGITVDQSGNVSTPDGLSITANGFLQALATTNNGTVTPGQVQLLTDALTLTPLTAGGTVIDAPDGQVAIAPLTAGTTIELDASGTASSAGTLVLTQAMLNAINTLGGSAGTAGTESLVLGSLDGTTPRAGAIDINTGIVLPGSGGSGIARNLVLDSTGAVQENAGGSLSVISLAGTAGASSLSAATGSFLLTNGNTIAELGNVGTRIVGGTTYVTAGSPAPGLLNITSNGDVRISDSTGSMIAVGTVTANAAGTLASGTIALTAPAMEIISGAATLSTGTIISAGSLQATAGTVSSGTITPSKILLTADGLRIIGTPGTPIVRAPSGEVAIGPMTAGRTISIDATGSLGGSTLSLGVSDLALIDTMSGALSGVTPGPTGTQTLALGSVDDGATSSAGGIEINTQLTLGGTANLTGNTLALYSTGDVVETPIGANPTSSVTVNTLIGTVTAGSVYLNGANHISNIGNFGTRSGFTTPSPVDAGLVAANGNILLRNDQDLNIVTVALAGGASPDYAEFDVLSGGNLTVLNGGTVTGYDVYLRAGDGGTSGNVTVDAGGSVLAGGNADLAAGVQYIAATPTSAPSHSYTLAAGGPVAGDVEIDGLARVGATGTLGLYAHDGINEPGTIQGGVLTGFAGTFANLSGAGSPTANQIADLADFSTNQGFLLRDGQALAVIGNGVTDTGVGITIVVAPTVAADLAIAAPITANTGTVELEATGNVYETNGTGGAISNSGGTFSVTGGMVNAQTLVSQAGVTPDTEPGGNTPGTIPASTFGRAIDWFGGTNHVATLGDVTASGNFLLHDSESLTLAGTVMAGTLPLSSGTIATAYAVTSGPFGTTPTSIPAPFAEIDVDNGGDLTIGSGATLHAGLDGSLTGNVTLRAGNATTAGAVTIDGDVFAADGGTVAVSAGYDPTITPFGSAYFGGCGSTACSITINGTIWGDSTLGSNELAGLVQLNAASSIDETPSSAMIGADTLSGFAGWHANLTEADFGATGTAVPLNQIGTLGAFSTNFFANDMQGFALRDGRSLTVAGPVQDYGSSASNISIAVMGGSGTNYGQADLTLQGDITANQTIGTVTLQATGNIVQTGGSITANALVAEAGAIPGTEATGTPPGSIAGSPVLATGSIVLTDANQINALGGGGMGVSAEGDIRITNVPSLTIDGTIMSANGTIVLTNTGGVTNNSTIDAMTQDVTITSGQDIDNPSTIEASNNVYLSAGGDIGNSGLINAITQDATLLAGRNIGNSGLVHAGNHVFAESGISTTGSIGNLGIIQADGSGSAGAPSIDLVALNGGGITQAASGTTTATADAAFIAMNADGDVTLYGSVLARGSQGLIGITAGGSFNQPDGAIIAGGPGSFGSPSIAITANTGSIVQGSTALISATGSSGVIGLHAAQDIVFAGSLTAPAGISLMSDSGMILEDPGSGILQTGMLVGFAGKSVSLTGTTGSGNLVANLGSFTANGGDFVLTDDQSLTVAGPVIANGGSVVITATHLAGGASSLVNNATIQGQAGVTLTADQDITNNGILQSLTNDVVVNAIGGTLTNNLLISAANDANLTAGTDIGNTTNAVITVGHFATLNAGGSIDDAGTIAAAGAGSSATPSLNMLAQTGAITEQSTGTIQASGANGVVSLVASNGSIDASGIIQTATLIGYAARFATIETTASPGNQIGNLGSFTVAANNGALKLNDDSDLQINGPLSAQTIDIDIGGHMLTLADGATIATGGTARPHGTLHTLPPEASSGAGAYFTAGSFRQLGISTVLPLLPTSNAILRIDTANGAISFNGAFNAGLNAPDTWLILDAGSGFLSGRINVKALDVIIGTGGAADLTGLINTYTGHAAAGQGNIEPSKNARYHVNGCPIGSVNCVLLPTEGLPAANPLDEFFLGSFFSQQDEADLLLPIVSDQDY